MFVYLVCLYKKLQSLFLYTTAYIIDNISYVYTFTYLVKSRIENLSPIYLLIFDPKFIEHFSC